MSSYYFIFVRQTYYEHNMIKERQQAGVPSRLNHHTTFEGLKGILSEVDSKGICFRAVSNRYKNDDQEIRMGEYMLKHIRENISFESSLNHFDGYNESASISFIEGESPKKMADDYGRFRIELDLRNHVRLGLNTFGFIDCEYVSKEDLKAYTIEYTSKYKECIERLESSSKKDIDGIIEMINIINDLKYKVYALKESKWAEENEWRIIIPLKETDPETLWTEGKPSKPYKNFHLPKECLLAVTVFSKDESIGTSERQEVEQYLREKNCNIPIKLVMIQDK